jgi:hypothetical protein
MEVLGTIHLSISATSQSPWGLNVGPVVEFFRWLLSAVNYTLNCDSRNVVAVQSFEVIEGSFDMKFGVRREIRKRRVCLFSAALELRY